MNRFWFPPLSLGSVFRLITSTSFLLSLSSQAIAQTPDDRAELHIQDGNSSKQPLWSDSFQYLDQSFPISELTDQWVSEELASTRLRYRSTSNLNPDSLWLHHTSDSETNSMVLEAHPRLVIEPLALHSLQTRATSLEDINVRQELGARSTPSSRYAASSPTAHPLEDSRSQLQQIGQVFSYRADGQGTEYLSVESASVPVEETSIPVTAESTTDLGVLESRPIDDKSGDIELSNLTLTEIDPELGILRLHPLINDGVENSSSAAVIDPELGVLRLRSIPQNQETAAVEPESSVFLQGYLGFFNGNNILARTEPLSDSTLQTGVTLRAVPRLGPRTFFVGTAGVSMLKYAHHGEFNYSDLDFSVGLYHWLTRSTYVDVGWRNQQFFAEDGGDRFLNDHQLRVALGRTDYLTSNLKLDSSYQLQSSWSDPRERSRLTNRFTLGLTHPVSSQLDASVSYQLALTDFTQQNRYDSYHQILAQLQFSLSEEAQLTIFGGGRLGESTHSLIDFDSTLFGLSFVMNFALF